MTPSSGSVLCHEDAHIHRDELGAPEFFTGGAKLVLIPGAQGKLHAEDVARWIGENGPPSSVSVTNATEAGTVYLPEETRAIADASGTRMHLDGARFANAVVSLGCSPAELTWKAGVDVLALGATKNGAMAAELLVVFRRELAKEIEPRWHRSGHRLSKTRFVSAQLDAYLADDLWLRNARRANDAAMRIARGIAAEVLQPVEANVVFVRLEEHVVAALREQGYDFYDWPIFGAGAVRLVTGFDTSTEDADAFVEAVARARTR
jgi:threonine aldolase